MITAVSIALITVVSAFGVPGLIPNNYLKGQKLDILVGEMASNNLYFPFHFYSAKWCPNTKGQETIRDTVAISQMG